jgi:hypothetical protein
MANLVKKLGRRLRKLLAGPKARRHDMVGPGHLWREARDLQIAFLTEEGLEPGHTLLDVGCGTLRGGVAFIGYLEPGRYWGVDVRAEALDEGRRELREEGLDGKAPHLVLAEDLGALDLGARFDYVWAYVVLIHMTDDVLDGCLGMVARHLAADGVFFGNVNVGAKPDGVWDRFPVMFRSVAFYEEAARRHGLRATDLGTMEDLGYRLGTKGDRQHMLRFERAD